MLSVEQEINALLDKAAPLRALPEDEQGELAAIVDRINELRAIQANSRDALDEAIAERDEAEFQAVADSVNPEKRKPGRPRKDQAA